jgi:hypothetical protein
MTAGDVLAIVLRRWYLMVVAALVWLGLLWVATHQPPVYFSQFEVVVLPPHEHANPNTLAQGPYELAPLASVVVAGINGTDPPREMGSAGTTLYGEGVRQGHRVRMRNWGTQWQPVYTSPIIDVQVVDRSPQRVEEESARLIAQIGDGLTTLQVESHVTATSAATLQVTPVVPVVQWVGGSRARAAGSVALFGALSSTVLVVGLDRRLAARRTGVK